MLIILAIKCNFLELLGPSYSHELVSDLDVLEVYQPLLFSPYEILMTWLSLSEIIGI
jgi:hypothetical protein